MGFRTMLQRFHVLGAVLATLAAGPLSAQTHRIAEHAVRHRTVLDVVAYTETSVPIHNPLRWPLISDVVSDGVWVPKSGLLASFDPSGPSNDLLRVYQQRDTAQAELSRDMADIDNSELDLKDRHAAVLDQIAVLEARRERLLAVPDPNEVAIAESRLRVATLAREAASNDYAKATTRLQDGLISRQECESREADRDDAVAQWEHAAALLAIARRPTPDTDLRRLDLELDNARLERDKITQEISANAVLVAIRKRGAGVRIAQLNRQTTEREEDLKATRVLAPIEGHVMYMPDFRRDVLDGGERMWKNNVFLRMPDAATLAFKGVIPEASRRFVSVGDPAELRLVGFGDTPVTATVASIGDTARDTAERETQGWGADNLQYGIKVYEVTLRPTEIAPWMRVGMHAEAVVTASQPVTVPAVPVPFVRMVGDRPQLALDGRFQPVAGTVLGDLLLLDDPRLLGRTVSLHADEPALAVPATEPLIPTAGALFTTTGELVPASSTPVVIRRIHNWQKITWLIPEDSVVTQGTVVARLDDKETVDEILDWESRLTSATSARETQEQSNTTLLREKTFQLAVASNAAETARLAYDAALQFTDDAAIADATRTLALARTRERSARRQLARLDVLPADRVAAVERTAAQRTLERASLQREAAELRLETAHIGKPVLERERLKVAYEEARLDLIARTTAAQTERTRADAELLKTRRREAQAQRNVEERRGWRDNLALTAPRDGIVRYNRVWSNDSFRRVEVGQVVGSRFTPLQIVDTARMEVRAEIPERHFGDVAVGQKVEVRIPSALDAPLVGTVRDIEFLFEQRRPKTGERGLYSAHEALGETVFFIRIDIEAPDTVALKPGAVATISLRKTAGASAP